MSDDLPPPRPIDSYAPPSSSQAIGPITPAGPSEPTGGAAGGDTAAYPSDIDASAPLKPLLNPLQTGDTPMPSTAVEPPRSPNPANEAADDKGYNVELDVPSSSASVLGPADVPPPPLEPAAVATSSSAVEVGAFSTDSVIPSTEFMPTASSVHLNAEMNSAGPSSPSPVPAPVPVPAAEDVAVAPAAAPRPPSPSSLPRDAPMPPTPNPTDEPPPAIQPGLIPPAVPTPEAITTVDGPEASEEPLRSAAPPPETSQFPSAPAPVSPIPPTTAAVAESAMEIEPPSAATSGAPPTPPEDLPAPASTSAPSIPVAQPEQPTSEPAPAAPAVQLDTPPVQESTPAAGPSSAAPPPPAESSDAMDVDAAGEADVPSEGLEASTSVSSLKRSGDELEGREEKRVKEDEVPLAPVPTPAIPAAAPSETPAAPAPVPGDGMAPIAALPPLDPNAPPPPWLSYQPPPPKPAGPTTPLTAPQHRHLLNTIRTMKKNTAALNFLEPVDVVRFGIPHYAQIIDKPMDLGTVETKLIVSDPRGPPKDKSKMSKWDTSKGSYGSVSEVVQDVRQIWENTRKFNGPTHLVSEAATKLETTFEKSLNNLPADTPAPPPAPTAAAPAASPAAAAAGPSSHTRRPSVSQLPPIRRSSDGPDARPKREIHPPPSKDLAYADASKPRKRNDPQLQWALKTLKSLEATNKTYPMVSAFLFPIEKIIEAFPQYPQVIKQPIDLNMIKARLEHGEYDDVSQADADLKLMFKNAMTFNPPGDPVNDAAQQFKQTWEERSKSMPAKVELKEESPDPIEASPEAYQSDGEDTARLHKLEGQLSKIQAEIDEIKSRQAARKQQFSKATKGKKPKAARKSGSKASPSANGHGHGHGGQAGGSKKSKKSKETQVKDEEEMDSEEEARNITLSQKQELAEKIMNVDASILNRAVDIIKETTSLSSSDEIELDIESLPQRTVYKLYNLVCRGGRKAPRAKPGQGKRSQAGKKAGGARKSVNEQQEEDRIRRMEDQLKNFDSSRGGGGGWGGEGGEESESSEEESSDEE